MIRRTEILSDEDRFNNFLQMLMRCCVKVMRTLLSNLVSWLGYPDVDRFLSSERAHLQKMPYASLSKSQAILYPGTATDIKQWDLSLLNCVLTQIQRKIILKEFGNPIDPVLINNRAQVKATPVGTKYEHILYPASGRPTDINKWSMTICSCLLSVLSPKPQTLLVRIAESLDNIRELRNGLCHPEDPAMTSIDYERHMPVLKTFIDAGLAYLGDEAFEAEIKKDMDDIENGKMKTYLLIDHRHLQHSYSNDRVIIQRLEDIEKAVKELPNQGDLNLLVFFGQLPREQKELLYASYIEIFNKCLANNMPEAVEDEELRNQITLASCMAWRYFENPYEGRHVLGVGRKCLVVKIGFDNVLWMWKFIKDYLYGRLESAFEPMQTLLRTHEGCEHLEINLAIPDMFTALMKIGQAVDIDIDSVMFLLEMMFQKSHLRLEESFAALCDRSTQTPQWEGQLYNLSSGKSEYDESGKSLIEKTERLSVEESKTSEPSVDEAGKKGHEMEVPGKKLQSIESAIYEFASKSGIYTIKEKHVVPRKNQLFASCITKKLFLVCIVFIRFIVQVVIINKEDYTPVDLTSLRYTRDPDIPFNGSVGEMLLLYGDRLLTAEWINHEMKIFDLRTNNLIRKVGLPTRPWSMCILPGDRVAVASLGGIHFFETRSNLSLDGYFKVDGEALGIGYHNDRLIVSYISGKVEIMDMNGNVIKTIHKADNGQKIFRHPNYLNVVSEVNTAVIYVSDFAKSTITKLDMNLSILQTFQDPALIGPRGITAVGNQLLICGNTSNNIMSLDLPSGQMTQLLGEVEETKHPTTICYDHKQNKMYVNNVEDNSIQVYIGKSNNELEIWAKVLLYMCDSFVFSFLTNG